MTIAAIDTNILIYAVDHLADRSKHEAAAELLHRLGASGRAVLPLQALSEFFVVATRKGQARPEEASDFIDSLVESFPVREPTLADLRDAIRVNKEHNVSFWDGMLWSVARRAGARYVLSEDFQDGRELEGVLFLNPFLPGNATLLGRITAAETPAPLHDTKRAE